MRNIYFPGNSSQPCKAQYGIALDRASAITHATIVVHQGPAHMPATSILNSSTGLDTILNRVLENDLRGVRVELIRFIAILELDSGRLEAREYAIHLDVDDYVARGNPCEVSSTPAEDIGGVLLKLIGQGNKQYSFWSGHVVGGCARFYLDSNEKGIVAAEAERLLEAVR